MKKLSLIIALFAGMQLMAQERPIVSSAVIAYEANELADAKKYIDEAAQIIGAKDLSQVKPKTLSKFYFHNAMINFRISQHTDEALKALDADALDKSKKSFEDLLAYEEKIGKKRYTSKAEAQLPYLAVAYASRGIDKDANKDVLGAMADFETSYNIKLGLKDSQTDTTMLYNAALMAQKAKMYDKAIKLNNQLIEMNYKGVEYSAVDEAGVKAVFSSKYQRDASVKAGKYFDPKEEGDYRADIYLATANMYKKTGDTTTYDSYIAKGRTMFPTNEPIIRAELQKFLMTKQFDKALVNLNLAIDKDPSSKELHYIKGNILHTSVKDLEAAVVSYDAAIALDPEYIDPLYMKGLIHIDAANALTLERNEVPRDQTAKFNRIKAEEKAEFGKALPFFEKAYAINAEDLDTLRALKEIYFKLKMMDDLKRIIAETKVVESKG